MGKTTKLWAMALLAAGCFAATEATAAIRYVAADGTGDGSSWTAASGDLQVMINASASGDEVWVKAGTYKPAQLIDSKRKRSYSFILKSGVSLHGGFTGTETSKDERIIKGGGKNYEYVNETILSADDDTPDVWTRELEAGSTYRYSWNITGNENNSNHVLYNNDGLTDKTEVTGFTMKGANADEYRVYSGGGAIYAKGWLEVRGCTFKENVSRFKPDYGTKDYYGGAVAILSTAETQGKAIVEDCLFENNFARSVNIQSFGGGLYIDHGTVKNSEFKGCLAYDNGGAIYGDGANIENCIFDDCYASSGGAIYNNGGSVKNVTATNCRSLQGGAVYNSGSLSYAKIANCYSDAEEYASMGGGKGGGIYNAKGQVLGCVVTNCTAYEGGGVYLVGGTIVNSTVQRNSVRNTETASNANIFFGTLAEASTILNTIGNPDADAANFVKPSSFTGWSTEEAKQKEAIEASWELAKGSSFIDSGKATEGVTETIDIAGNPRVAGASIDVGAYEYVAAEEPKEPNLVLTFETNDEVTFGTGGYAGSSFSVDWGNGELKTYEGAVNITGTPTDKVVKIYGDELVILKAINAGLTAVDMTNAPTISQVQIGYNKLTSLDVSNNTGLTGLYCEENQITSLDVSKLARLRVLDCHNNKLAGKLDCSAMVSLSKVDCSQNELTELVIPAAPNLIDVLCGYNKLTSLDLSPAKGLTSVECNNNEITSLDVSKNTLLEEIYCPTNKLTAIDVTNNTALKTLTAFENQIESIDLSKNTALEGLYLQDNKLSELDLENNPGIKWFAASNNNLTSIDVSKMSGLTSLIVSGNKLTTLDISNNPSIFRLEAGNNQLSEIDVTKQSSLSTFIVTNNQISKLDVSKNGYLYWLLCGNNKIESLDLTNNSYLQRLEANGNLLKSLDLSKNTGLQGLMLQGNQMDGEAINTIIKDLPDVSSLEINDNNREWGRQLNVSDMPGTPEAKKADAEAKGWIVTATGGGSVDGIESESTTLSYDAASFTVRATEQMARISVYTASGRLVASAEATDHLTVETLSKGLYLARATDLSGHTHSLKFIR